MTTEGKSDCLDAFIIALNQACDGLRWYVSTLELQLVSLEFCEACRSVPTLHIRVNRHTPPGLRFPRKIPTILDECSRAGCLSDRVPAVQALCLTWELPLKVLEQRSALEKRLGLARRQLTEPPSTARAQVRSMTCGQLLQQAAFPYFATVNAAAWPASLQELRFGWCFNESILGVGWPVSLQQMSFGSKFNQPIAEVVWPASLQRLSLGDHFNCSIVQVVWPASLQQLTLSRDFNQPIAEVLWPASLQQLSFGRFFNQPILGVGWPVSLQQLSFGLSFNQPIAEVLWPASLQQLSFGRFFNQPIAEVLWPASLQQLSFGRFFNQPILGVGWPVSLQQVSFGSKFNQPMAEVVWPASVRSVTRDGRSLLQCRSTRKNRPFLEWLKDLFV